MAMTSRLQLAALIMLLVMALYAIKLFPSFEMGNIGNWAPRYTYASASGHAEGGGASGSRDEPFDDCARTDPNAYLPSSYTPVCALAIVMAGMPRTGSTVQTRIARYAAQSLGLKPAKEWYWRRHCHNPFRRESTTARRKMRDQEMWKLQHATSRDVLVLKTHEYDANIMNVCRKTLVFTSHRCVKDEVLSEAKLKWLNITRTESTTEMMLRQFQYYRLWKQLAHIDFAHEEMASTPMLAFKEAMIAIEETVFGSADDMNLREEGEETSTKYPDCPKLTSEGFEGVACYLTASRMETGKNPLKGMEAKLRKEGNPMIPSTHTKGTRSTTDDTEMNEQLARIHAILEDEMDNLNLRWECTPPPLALPQGAYQGVFQDPNHPEGWRRVTVGEDGSVTIVGKDSEEEEWKVVGLIDAKSGSINLDFSSKGGPADIEASWDESNKAIVFGDGNKWTRIEGKEEKNR